MWFKSYGRFHCSFPWYLRGWLFLSCLPLCCRLFTPSFPVETGFMDVSTWSATHGGSVVSAACVEGGHEDHHVTVRINIVRGNEGSCFSEKQMLRRKIISMAPFGQRISQSRRKRSGRHQLNDNSRSRMEHGGSQKATQRSTECHFGKATARYTYCCQRS